VPVTDLTAQEALSIKSGDRVRLKAPWVFLHKGTKSFTSSKSRGWLTGSVVSLGADTLVLAVKIKAGNLGSRLATLTIPLASVTKLEERRGPSIGAGVFWGAL